MQKTKLNYICGLSFPFLEKNIVVVSCKHKQWSKPPTFSPFLPEQNHHLTFSMGVFPAVWEYKQM